MSFSMSPPPPKPAPSPAPHQQQPPPQQNQQQPQQQQQQVPPPPPQPQQQQQQPYVHPPAAPSPYQQYPSQQSSPANASPYPVPPPAKRQRLSPHPQSPPPPYTNGGYHAPPPNLPGASSYGNPYAPSPAQAQTPYSPNAYAQSPQSSFNTPQPYPPQQMPWQSAPNTPAPAVQRAQQQSTGSPQPNSQMMPPPPRPNKEEKEEKGVDDVTDVMHGSGINLKDEENYLHTLYTNQHTAKDSFGTQGSSFGSGTLSGGNSFNTLQGTSFDGQNGAFAGTLGQPASQDDVEKEEKRKREAAAREKAERDQHHLNNPFLLGNVLRLRMDKIARENGVRLDVQGLYLLQQPAEPTKVMTNGTNSTGIVRPGSKIDQGAPFADILSLVSLAAGERARSLLDDAHALSRARLYGDHSRVPPDLADLAIAPGNEMKDETVQPENITGTEWDRLPDAPGGPEDNDNSSTTKPQHTVSFQASINNHFRELAEKDKAAEKERIRKREARRKAAEAAAENEDGSGAALPDASAATSTPAGDQDKQQPKMTKKEQMKQQKEAKNASESQMNATTNQTAALMAFGKKSKKYSWMSGPSMPTNRFAKPSAPSSGGGGGGSGSASGGTNTPVKKEGARTPIAGAAAENDDAGMVKWGEWKEDNGVQLRDWALVLERDGREKKALQRALNSMK